MRGKKKKWGDGMVDGARVSIFFTKNTILWGGGFGWGEGVQLVNFSTKNPNLKKSGGGC